MLGCDPVHGCSIANQKSAGAIFIFPLPVPVLAAAHLAFGQPLVGGDTGESDELAREADIRETALEQVVYRANRHIEPGSKLMFVFIFRLP